MWDFLEGLLGGGFMPHGHCYLWTPALVWTQVSSNALIGIAYLSISMTLLYLVKRAKLPFSWVYLAFGLFILACGFTHFIDIATVWHPIYWVDAAVRVVTAIASVGTAALVFPLVPKVVTLSNVSALAHERGEKLEAMVLELTATNERLRHEQEERARLASENATLAERAKIQEFQERFIAVLGHDLRNPLAAVSMGAELLKQTATPSDLPTFSSGRLEPRSDDAHDRSDPRLHPEPARGGLEISPLLGRRLQRARAGRRRAEDGPSVAVVGFFHAPSALRDRRPRPARAGLLEPGR